MMLVEPGRSQKDVSLEWDVRIDSAVSLPAAQVRQVALNLLLNAIDASPRGGQVRSTALVEEDVLRITVTDNGPGFSPDELERVFEPHESSTHGGEGLGLWVTHQLVQELNGKIEVTRRDGRTSFVVNVPVVQGELHEPAHLSH